MADLKTRLHEVDQVPVPELWAEVQDRVATTSALRGSSSYRLWRQEGFSWGRLGTIVIAFAVFVGVVVFAWRFWEPSSQGRVGTPRPGASLEPVPWRGLAPGFHQFSPPSSSRTSPALVWTGEKLIVWGGSQSDGAVQFNDGFMFDPAHDSWRNLPASPLSARSFPASVWTGNELVIWGGWDGHRGHFDDGAAYDPSANIWRTIAPSPLDARAPRGAVWTGTEIIVWGTLDAGTPSDLRDVTGAAYDPGTNTWRRIADAPYPINWGSVVWTGREMIVLGASVHALNRSDTADAVGMAYDPASDKWTKLPPTDLDPNGTFAIWANDELFAFDYSNLVRSYDPVTDVWRDLPPPPTDAGEAWPRFATASDQVFAWTFSGPAVFDLVREAWDTPQLPRAVDGYLTPLAAGDAVIMWETTARDEAPPDLMVWVPAGSGEASTSPSTEPSTTASPSS